MASKLALVVLIALMSRPGSAEGPVRAQLAAEAGAVEAQVPAVKDAAPLPEKPAAKLEETLVFENMQGGVAGLMGLRYVVEPSGKVQAYHVVGAKHAGLIWESQMKPEAASEIAEALVKHHLAQMPRKLDFNSIVVNPRHFRIAYGVREVTVELPPRFNFTDIQIDPKNPQQEALTDFAKLARIIDERVQAAAPPPLLQLPAK